VKDVCAHAEKSCTIKLAKTPAQYGDLNDWTHAGATSDDLLQAMVLAETAREIEVSWTDALNAAVVRSNELHDLELIARKKLLEIGFARAILDLFLHSAALARPGSPGDHKRFQ
jgi:hypothetical protein